MAKKTNKETNEIVKYTKEQLLKSVAFQHRKDAIGVVIKDDELVTIEEAAERLENFMKGKVR